MIQKNLEESVLYLLIFISLLITVQSSTHCSQSCIGSTPNHVPYPFGFTEGCQIRLNCTNNTISIGEFQVQNITSDSIFVSIPANCSRPIQKLVPLFNPNYALMIQNGLLLKNCKKPLNGCEIPQAMMQTQFQFKECGVPHCFLDVLAERKEFMSFDSVLGSNCTLLYSAIATANRSSLVSLEFQRVQLGWWLEGNCSCSENATCRKVKSPINYRLGFRCQCIDGYEGDGFLHGQGCRRKASSNCNLSKFMSGQCGGTTRIGVLIGGIIAGASLVTGLAFLFYSLRRRSNLLKAQKRTKRLLSEAAGDCTVPFYTYKEIERGTYNFSEKHRLGTGAYGTVYAGKLHNDEWVAIKKIRYQDRDGIEQIMNEIKLLSSVSHPNLVRLLGFCIERGEQILVYEFMPNGTLSQHLQRERGTGLPWTIRLNIVSETAQAIAHLHSAMYPPIYHRDIKSSNILLDHNFNSKVADFGLSRLGMTESSHISTAPQGTPGYLDPQYHQNFHLSDKSDVYSFGVVLIEIITALKVVDFSRPQNHVNLASLAVDKIGKGCVDEIIDPFIEAHRNAWTLSSVHMVAELAFRCLAFHRDMRPSMMEAAAELEQIKLSGWAPLEDNNCIASSVESCGSSPSNGKKAGLDSKRLIFSQKEDHVISTDVMDCSPVSVQNPWFSDEQSSPSTNSLLNNVIP